MRIVQTSLPGIVVIEPRVIRDVRGAFAEQWRRDDYATAGIPETFVQDNVSWSARDVLRGLHFQNPRPQGKLITALLGAVYDVAVDVRPESPTFGQWVGIELSADTMRQIYIPAGFAHGFLVISDEAVVSYKCTDYYAPQHEHCLRWDDPQIGITWPIHAPVLSARDAAARLLSDLFPADS